MSYRIEDNGTSIVCLSCNHKSYNPNDVLQRYCGHCHRFHEPRPVDQLLKAAKGAWHMCQSGLHNQMDGNCLIAPDLLRECAEALSSAIRKVEAR